MSNIVCKFRIYCNSEAKWVEGWSEAEPSVCYNNNTHSVNENSVQLLEELSISTVYVKEEQTPEGQIATGGNFKVEAVCFDATGNTTTEHIKNWPFPVSVLAVKMHPSANQEGDVFQIHINEDYTYGTITSTVNSGDTVIPVSATVLAYANKGYYLKLSDGINTEDLGRILAIDKDVGTVTVETATTNQYLATTPTLVKMTIKMVEDFEIGPSHHYTMGDDKIGGSYVHAYIPIKIVYTNNTADQKHIRLYAEYIY